MLIGIAKVLGGILLTGVGVVAAAMGAGVMDPRAQELLGQTLEPEAQCDDTCHGRRKH